MYVSETDYFSYGKVYVYDAANTLVTTFDVGVSPGNFAFDVRTASAIADAVNPTLNVAPNPAATTVQVTAPFKAEFAEILNINGQVLYTYVMAAQEQVTIDVTNLAAGMYCLRLRGAEVNDTAMFQKQ